MEDRPDNFQELIDPAWFGISFSLKQCRNFGLDPQATLDWLIAQGWRRFRLMSYWDLHEPVSGGYSFAELDWQIATIARAGGTVTLCLGVKQPRWPEYHWPSWAWQLPKAERDKALIRYLAQTVSRYKENPVVASWQLENEALLQGFGEKIDIDRARLRQEYALVRQLDGGRHPVCMSTSNGWGVPVRAPRPGRVGFSFYPVMYKNGRYRRTIQKPWLHRLRTHVIHVLLGKQVFLHELQCEPWGPAAIWKMSVIEQHRSMNTDQLRNNISSARKIANYPIDLWGAEWWYWRWSQGDESINQAVLQSLHAE